MYGNSEGGHTRNIYLRQINNFIAFLGFPPESQFEKVPWSGPSSAYGGLSSVLKFLRLLSRSTLVTTSTQVLEYSSTRVGTVVIILYIMINLVSTP